MCEVAPKQNGHEQTLGFGNLKSKTNMIVACGWDGFKLALAILVPGARVQGSQSLCKNGDTEVEFCVEIAR